MDVDSVVDSDGGRCDGVFRSRTKNMMWYGVLGTKELLHRTYKNLEQRVLLEVSVTGPGQSPTDSSSVGGRVFTTSCLWAVLQCDGRPIPLPSLQGIAVLNIPSYAGGTKFWGGSKEDDVRTKPSLCSSLCCLSVCLTVCLSPSDLHGSVL